MESQANFNLNYASGVPLIGIVAPNGKKALIRADLSVQKLRRHFQKVILPETTGKEVQMGSTATFVQFKVEPTQMEETFFDLHFNDVVSTSPVDSIPFPQAIKDIEIIDTANKVHQTITGVELWLAYASIPTDQLSTILSGNVLNMDTGLKSTGLIPVGTRNRVIRLLGPFISLTRYRLFTDTLYIKFNFENSIAINGTSNANIKFTDFKLVARSEEVHGKEVYEWEQRVLNSPMLIPFGDAIYQKFEMTLAASTLSSRKQMTSFVGKFGEIYAWITKASDNDPSLFKAIGPDATFPNSDTDESANFRFLDGDGKLRGSTNGISARYSRYGYWGEHSHSQVGANVPIYAFGISDDPFSLLHKGIFSGCEAMDGKQFFEFTPGANFVNASDYTVHLLGIRRSNVIVDYKTGKMEKF